jgi:hypothetical protein
MFILIWIDKTVVIYTMLPIGPNLDWLSYAITDATLFHTTLAVSAMHLAQVNCQRGSHSLFLHQTKAIQTLQEKLSDPVMRVGDAALCTIAALALLQVNSHHL